MIIIRPFVRVFWDVAQVETAANVSRTYKCKKSRQSTSIHGPTSSELRRSLGTTHCSSCAPNLPSPDARSSIHGARNSITAVNAPSGKYSCLFLKQIQNETTDRKACCV